MFQISPAAAQRIETLLKAKNKAALRIYARPG